MSPRRERHAGGESVGEHHRTLVAVAVVARAARGRPHCGLKLTKLSTPTKPRASTTTMGAAYDFAPERPDHIQQILDGLDRYNPETTGVFQDYVMQQCESQTYDCYANLALLKLYVSRVAPSPALLV
jgi:hypothetical protein